MTYYLAVDIGASSGRHMLGHVSEGRMILEEMYRFDNQQIRRDGQDCWNVEALYQNILKGMRVCREAGKIPVSMAVDTWGVDFVLLDPGGKPIGNAVSYRDGRTRGMDEQVSRRISPQELYQRTGIQKQIFNTIYQLEALKTEYPQQLEQAESLLMIPDYFHFLLTGVKKQEYTNATTSGLVNAGEKCWDASLIEALGLPKRLFGELSMPGTVVGNLLEDVQREVGFDCQVILPASHDTASAFLAVPAKDSYGVYLSSGTWSLLGVERGEPICSESSRRENFTNEGGYDYRFRYLKNIMGLWMLQSIRREWNGVDYVEGKPQRVSEREKRFGLSGGPEGLVSFPDMIAMAREWEVFPSTVNVDAPCFLAPDSMIGAVKDFCASTGQKEPRSLGEVIQCVYRSLICRYGESIRRLEELTGCHYTSIHIVGGGCQDEYLNEKIAESTGLPVYAGPVEGTALGNLMVQMLRQGEYSSLRQAREGIRKSFPIRVYQPGESRIMGKLL